MVQSGMPIDFKPTNSSGNSSPFKNIQPSPTSNFSTLMQKGPGTQASSSASPMDIIKNGIPSPNNPQVLLAALQTAQNTMGTIQGQMSSYANFKMKPSQKHLVRSKLASAQEQFGAIQSKMQEYFPQSTQEEAISITKDPEHKESSLEGPLSQFLGYLTDGVNQIESAKRQVAQLGKKGAELNAGDFLLIQIKLAKAQQELEFTSAILAKAVEDFKMIMNIQL